MTADFAGILHFTILMVSQLKKDIGHPLPVSYWRARAAESRALAADETNSEFKKDLMRLAAGYDELARVAQELQDGASGKSTFGIIRASL